MQIPMADAEEEDSDGEAIEDTPQGEEDPFDTILDAYSFLTETIIANRILAFVYIQETDYPNAIKAAESGLELVRRAEMNDCKPLPQ